MVRRFQISLVAVLLAAVFSTLAIAQGKAPAGKNTNTGGPAAIERGRIVYADKCEVCHFSDSEDQKIGAGMKGIYKRGKYADGSKVDDASMEKWIVNGGKSMPPYKEELNPGQIHDLIAYIKTL
jgi:mono/diheme cytochrome c family protein